jgi:hypothetical protein
MKKFRVSKSPGWNRYTIQKKHFGFIWLNYKTEIFVGYHYALIAASYLNAQGDI